MKLVLVSWLLLAGGCLAAPVDEGEAREEPSPCDVTYATSGGSMSDSQVGYVSTRPFCHSGSLTWHWVFGSLYVTFRPDFGSKKYQVCLRTTQKLAPDAFDVTSDSEVLLIRKQVGSNHGLPVYETCATSSGSMTQEKVIKLKPNRSHLYVISYTYQIRAV